MRLKISEYKIKVKENIDIDFLFNSLSECLRCKISNLRIEKKSLDARKKPDLFYVYTLSFDVLDRKLADRLLKNKKLKITEFKEIDYRFPVDGIDVYDNKRPVIVGFGPAGFICAYSLAKIGLRPIVLERGSCVEKRIKAVQDFWDGKALDINCNIQFGEGGAGTFSDGKLQTGVKDKTGRIKYILKVLVENGAPEEILYDSKPHIGTDILTEVVKNIRRKILEFGGEIRFNTRFVRCLHNNFMLTGAVIENEDGESIIETDRIVLAIGHSARDTFKNIFKDGIAMDSKPFAVGFRAIHKQNIINESQYGKGYPKFLPASDYKVTYKAKSGRGVYSFCMCPGGYVVNASSEDNMTAVNGMSYSHRNSVNANSAIVITIDKDVFGDGVFAGLEFQRKLEVNTYKAGNGKIPVEKLSDFDEGRKENFNKASFELCIKGLYTYADLSGILPECLNIDISESFKYFGTVIEGFDKDVYLLGTETRTSSPVKILRDDSYQSNIKGVYPCGEGAGYAGGITSAALDGLKVAETVAMHYNSDLGIS